MYTIRLYRSREITGSPEPGPFLLILDINGEKDVMEGTIEEIGVVAREEADRASLVRNHVTEVHLHRDPPSDLLYHPFSGTKYARESLSEEEWSAFIKAFSNHVVLYDSN